MNQAFERNGNIISVLFNHFIEYQKIEEVYIYGNEQGELNGIYYATQKSKIDNFLNCKQSSFIYVRIDFEDQFNKVKDDIQQNRKFLNFIIYASQAEVGRKIAHELKMCFCDLTVFSELGGGIIFAGPIFDGPVDVHVPEEFKVLAIMHFYNENDVLQNTIEYLISQDIDLYLVDNWSDDGSYEIALEAKKKYPERIFMERFPQSGKTQYYEWYHQLERTEQLACGLEYNWYIHYDADEMRIGPWKGCTLRQTLYYVDMLGYNLIENTVIDHKITRENENIFMKDSYFDFGHRVDHFLQGKTWKKTEGIELKSSGGHIAKVDNPNPFPLKILNRHYPLRSVEQAKKKILIDRRPRFEKERKERDWHSHYDKIDLGKDIVVNERELIKWDERTFDNLYIPLFTGIGVRREKNVKSLEKIETSAYWDKNIVIYGAGKIGKQVYSELVTKANIVAWVDGMAEKYGAIFGKKIQSPVALEGIEADIVLIAVKNKEKQKEIKCILKEKGVSENIVRCIGDESEPKETGGHERG